MAKEQAEQRKADAKKLLEERREETKKANEAAIKRAEESRPTPTQEENDLAKLGVAVDEHEDDKSGEEVVEKTVYPNRPVGYETRAARAKREQQG